MDYIHNQLFQETTFDKKVQDIARSLEFKDPRVLQSMCIFKQPTTKTSNNSRDNAVPPHTDATFYTLIHKLPLAFGARGLYFGQWMFSIYCGFT